MRKGWSRSVIMDALIHAAEPVKEYVPETAVTHAMVAQEVVRAHVNTFACILALVLARAVVLGKCGFE